LQEALKYNFEHANIWKNVLLLSVDTADFATAIKAFHRLVDLRGKHSDDEILGILVKETLKRRKNDPEELAAVAVQKDLVKLFARLAATQSLSAEVCRLEFDEASMRVKVMKRFQALRSYALIRRPDEAEKDPIKWDKYLQVLEKALNASTNQKVSELLEDEKLRDGRRTCKRPKWCCEQPWTWPRSDFDLQRCEETL